MTRAAAFFDVDSTLVATHVMHHYLYFRRRMMSRTLAPVWTAAFLLARGPYYLTLDQISRIRSLGAILP